MHDDDDRLDSPGRRSLRSRSVLEGNRASAIQRATVVGRQLRLIHCPLCGGACPKGRREGCFPSPRRDEKAGQYGRTARATAGYGTFSGSACSAGLSSMAVTEQSDSASEAVCEERDVQAIRSEGMSEDDGSDRDHLGKADPPGDEGRREHRTPRSDRRPERTSGASEVRVK